MKTIQIPNIYNDMIFYCKGHAITLESGYTVQTRHDIRHDSSWDQVPHPQSPMKHPERSFAEAFIADMKIILANHINIEPDGVTALTIVDYCMRTYDVLEEHQLIEPYESKQLIYKLFKASNGNITIDDYFLYSYNCFQLCPGTNDTAELFKRTIKKE